MYLSNCCSLTFGRIRIAAKFDRLRGPVPLWMSRLERCTRRKAWATATLSDLGHRGCRVHSIYTNIGHPDPALQGCMDGTHGWEAVVPTRAQAGCATQFMRPRTKDSVTTQCCCFVDVGSSFRYANWPVCNCPRTRSLLAK